MNNPEENIPPVLVNLKLTVEQVNTILKALGNLPFNQVFELIGTIHDQANSQAGGEE